LTLDEFVSGCLQFVGGARQLDIARMRSELGQLQKDIIEYRGLLEAMQPEVQERRGKS